MLSVTTATPCGISLSVKRRIFSRTISDAMLKKIGSKAREDMERFFGCKIDLRLWVKVKEDWRQRPQILTKLGFNEHDFDQYQ